MLPRHGWNAAETFHELQGRAGCPQPAEPRRGEDTAPYQLARFMVPKHGRQTAKTLHEPERRTPVRRGAVGAEQYRAEREFGAPFVWFIVPMHARKRKEALHEPKRAAGILPADVPEPSTAGKMPAAR